MDNLSQLHCVFDILSGALSSGLCACTIRRRSTSPVACTAALGTCKLLEEPRGIRSQHASSAMEVLRTAQTGLQRQCRKLGPRSEKHNNSRWANQRPVTIQRAPWSNRWTATKIRRGCILYRGRRYQRGTPTSVLRSGLANMAPEVADWTVLRFSSPASHASGHGGITNTACCQHKAGEKEKIQQARSHSSSPLLLSAWRRGVGECGGITLPRQVPERRGETPPPSTDDMWWLVGTGALGAPNLPDGAAGMADDLLSGWWAAPAGCHRLGSIDIPAAAL